MALAIIASLEQELKGLRIELRRQARANGRRMRPELQKVLPYDHVVGVGKAQAQVAVEKVLTTGHNLSDFPRTRRTSC